MDLASARRSSFSSILLALVVNAGCIYVTGVADYEKGTCEGSCADTGVVAETSTDVGDTGAKCPSDMVFVAGGGYVPVAKPGGGIVRIDGLCVDKTEVTESAYRACVMSGACVAPDSKVLCNYAVPGRENDAINCVNLTQAKTYCQSVAKRLPTEDEWEWVARGGPLGFAYPWGNVDPMATDNPERLCWQGKTNHADATPWPNRPAGTCPVGQFASGARDGIFDLAGNVWEWTSTEAAGSTFVFRGGSAFDDVSTSNYKASAAKTGASAPYPGVGMRCFKTAP